MNDYNSKTEQIVQIVNVENELRDATSILKDPLKLFEEKKQLTIADVLQTQKEFMDLLVEKRNFPQFPVDMASKPGQKLIKDIMYDCMGELFEAGVLLKNSKQHRKTEIEEFDRASYIEELCDCLKFWSEILILSGISAEEFIKTFEQKTQINNDRINGNY